MRPLLILLLDLVAALGLFLAGATLQRSIGAPSWLASTFLLPFFFYVWRRAPLTHFRAVEFLILYASVTLIAFLNRNRARGGWGFWDIAFAGLVYGIMMSLLYFVFSRLRGNLPESG
jgi:hypothetical protein